MVKFIAFVFINCILISSLLLHAQNKDSLIHVARNEKTTINERLEAYKELSKIYLMNDDSLMESWSYEGISLAKKNNKLLFEGGLKNNLGAYYSAIGKIEQAIKTLQEAETIVLQADNNNKTLFQIYINTAQIFISEGYLQKAIIQADKGLQLQSHKYPTDSSLRANLLYIKGWTMIEDTAQMNNAAEVLKEALIYADNQEDNSSYYVILNAVTAAYSNLNIADSTIKYAKLCLLSNDVELMGGSFLHLGSAYVSINKPQAAIPYFLKAIEYIKQTPNVEGLKEAYLYLSKAYFAVNNSVQAYQYLEKYSHLSDSLNSSERKESLAKLEIEYETFKKDASIKELDLQNSQKTRLIIFIFIGIALALLVLYFLFARYRTQKRNELLTIKLEQVQKSLELEKKVSESELKALKSQMNPHFIFNALNGIQEQFMYGDKVKANAQLDNFTWLTRQILSVSGKKKIPLSSEIEILTKYLELEKMRFHDDFSYSFSLSENIDEDYNQIPPMIIQPFIENAIKHGLSHKKGKKILTISIDWQEEKSLLHVTIEDNGIGRQEAQKIKQNSKHESFSTYSVEQRLQLLAQSDNFQAFNYTDLVDDNGNAQGTQVILHIPC